MVMEQTKALRAGAVAMAKAMGLSYTPETIEKALPHGVRAYLDALDPAEVRRRCNALWDPTDTEQEIILRAIRP
jgi:hypothetical protein